MDWRWYICAVIYTITSLKLSHASLAKDISDDCEVLVHMGFEIFRCTKSAYLDRDECVPRGRRDGGRSRRRPGSFDPMRRVCDSRLDCHDGSDETLPECAPLHKVYCEDDLQKEVEGDFLDAFHCFGKNEYENDVVVGSSMCVSECQMCDGRIDCPNGADEVAEQCAKMRRKPFGCDFY